MQKSEMGISYQLSAISFQGKGKGQPKGQPIHHVILNLFQDLLEGASILRTYKLIAGQTPAYFNQNCQRIT